MSNRPDIPVMARLLILSAFTCCGLESSAVAENPADASDGWTLWWNDEFDGDCIDARKWKATGRAHVDHGEVRLPAWVESNGRLGRSQISTGRASGRDRFQRHAFAPPVGIGCVSCVFLLLSVPSASAAVWYVAPDGADSASGTKASPFGTVQMALDRAQPGDTIRLRPGVYRERVVFRRGGQSNAPAILEGEPGAILDASDPISLKWTPTADVAEGVWQASIDEPVITVTANGKIVTILNQRRVDPDYVQGVLGKAGGMASRRSRCTT